MGDLIDKGLEFGAGFDWISPLAAVLGNIVNGPSHTFLIPYDQSPLSGREVQWMLSKRGVQTWGAMVVSGTFMISVRLSQARWAQHLLEQTGVPIENPIGSTVGGTMRRPAPAQQKSSIMQRSRILQSLGGRR